VGDGVVPIGVARLDRPGRDVSIITYAGGVHLAREASTVLANGGIEAEILDLRTLVPLDHEAIARTVRATSRVVVLHEANTTMGFGAEIAAFVADELFGELDAPIRRVAAADSHPSYNAPEQAAWLPSVDRLVATVEQLAAY
jgi:pyruvate/2-oxoglutarate/acetoin dehydrogenase E1 component